MPADLPDGGTPVRRVVPDDWPALRDLRLEALADTPLAFLETLEAAQAAPEEDWRARALRGAEGGDAVQVMALDGEGRAVATSACSVDADGAWLAAVYVTPAWRGRGLLARLVERVAAWAGEQGQQRLVLEVHEDNRPARAAYARLGFVETGARRPHPLDPTGDELEMSLDLRGRTG